MKAAVLERIGRPLSIHSIPWDLWRVEPGQVLVKVLCSSICGSQLQEIDGLKGDPSHIPHLLGHEGCGVVVDEWGTGKVKRGDKVVMHWRKGEGMDVPGGFYGGIKSGPITTFSEYSIVSENRITKVDDDVPNDLTALLGCALSTALAIVENEARVTPETTVLVIGCGGLGLALIIALRAAGVKHVLGTDKSERKQRMVNELGAQFLFNPAGGLDLIIDTTGNYGHLAGNSRYISLQKGGTEGGGFNPTKDIPRYVQMWRDGKLNDYPKLITHRISLDEINKGISLMRDGKSGRVMIEMDR